MSNDLGLPSGHAAGETSEERSGGIVDQTAIELAQTFADIARALLGEEDVKATLDKITQLAVETIEGCNHAGVSLVQRRHLSTAAASDDIARRVDVIQYEADEGPCLDAIRDHESFKIDDLSSEDRWPTFSRRAAQEAAIASMLSYRLFADEDTLGALNLYSKRREAFDDQAVKVGSVFATHAAVALAGAQHDEQMQEALQSRDLIGQAKGVLMAKQGVSAEDAFDMLRRASQRLNMKLREVAERVASQPERQEGGIADSGFRADSPSQ